MKIAARVIPACLMSAALTFSACNYTKPVMYINIANVSGHAMRNLELTHPTGTFGLPELRNGQTHQHMAPIGAFQVLVTGAPSALATFSSGAGQITVTCDQSLQVLNYWPTPYNGATAENSNMYTLTH